MPHITQEQYDAAVKAGIIKPAGGWYEPKKRESYWLLNHKRIDYLTCDQDDIDDRIFSRQQVFRTKEEAEKEDAKRIALTTIKRWCALNAPFTPDWGSEYERNWVVGYHLQEKKFKPFFDRDIRFVYQLPYLSKESDAEKLIELFDKELRLIFEIE